jgi:hypothetical protein
VLVSNTDFVYATGDDSYVAKVRMKNKYKINCILFICNSKEISINFTPDFMLRRTFIQDPSLKNLCEIQISYEVNSPPCNSPFNGLQYVGVETGKK